MSTTKTTTTTATSEAGTNHYAHIRYEGLGGRDAGKNEAPLRICNGVLAIKRKGVILPVIAIRDGFAIVPIWQTSLDKLADTPRTAEGKWDWDALAKVAPAITNPWDLPELAGIRFRGTKADASKAKAKPKASEAKAVTKSSGLPLGQPKAAQPKAPQPKAEPQLTYTQIVEHMAGLANQLAAMQQALTAMQPKAGARKAK